MELNTNSSNHSYFSESGNPFTKPVKMQTELSGVRDGAMTTGSFERQRTELMGTVIEHMAAGLSAATDAQKARRAHSGSHDACIRREAPYRKPT